MKIVRQSLVLFALGINSLHAFAYEGTDLHTQKTIHFAEDPAKVSVLVFLSAKCPCSASHEAALKELHKKYSLKGIEFIGIHSNQDEKIEMTKAHFEASALPFPIIDDQGSKLANELKALKTPHVFVLKNGKSLFEGGVDDSADASSAREKYLDKALSEITEGKPVKLARVRTLGCAIKR